MCGYLTPWISHARILLFDGLEQKLFCSVPGELQIQLFNKSTISFTLIAHD